MEQTPAASLKEAISRNDKPYARALMRRLFEQDPSLSNAQLVLRDALNVGFITESEPFKLAFLRSFTVEPLFPIIRAAAAIRGINLHVEVGGFNTYAQDILQEDSWVYRSPPNVIVLAIQGRDILPELYQDASGMVPSKMQAAVQQVLANLRNWIATLRSRSKASIVLQTIDYPLYPAAGILDAQRTESQQGAIADYNRGLQAIAATTSGVYVLDLADLIARFGRSRWYDEYKWNLARFPLSANAIPHLAKEYAKYVQVLSGKLAKVIAVDLDNTLWGGIVGEDGFDGIKLGPDHRGLAFQNLQRALLDLYHRGIVLAICSKNNPDDAMAVLERHPGMILRPSHFAALRINWQDKAANLREIAAELNLGLDSIVFLDDNPAERARIAQELPGVHVLEIPEDPSQYAGIIRECPLFERLSLSEEDRERSRYYAEERQRRDIQQSVTSIEDFYRSLDMEAEIAEATPETIKRIAQLTQKTNQFNLTTRRYTEQGIADMAARPDIGVYSLRSRDRFGDNGLVGVLIAKTQGATCEIDTLLLSCRVIGRTLEKAMLAYVAEDASKAGARFIEGSFIPTAKNAPAKDFYPSNGFQLVEEGVDGKTLWRLDLNEKEPEWPVWVNRTGVLQTT